MGENDPDIVTACTVYRIGIVLLRAQSTSLFFDAITMRLNEKRYLRVRTSIETIRYPTIKSKRLRRKPKKMDNTSSMFQVELMKMCGSDPEHFVREDWWAEMARLDTNGVSIIRHTAVLGQFWFRMELKFRAQKGLQSREPVNYCCRKKTKAERRAPLFS